MSTYERLHDATLELAGAGSIKQRLFGAYSHHLAALSEDEMPKEIREDFCALSRVLHSVRPLPGEDAVRATVRKMSTGDANRCAVQIVNMFNTLGRAQQGAIRQSQPAEVVKLYADR